MSRSTSAGRPSRSAPSRNVTGRRRSTSASGSPVPARERDARSRRLRTGRSGHARSSPRWRAAPSGSSGRRSRPTAAPRRRSRPRRGSACRRCRGRRRARAPASRALERPGEILPPVDGDDPRRMAGGRHLGQQTRLDVLARRRAGRPARPSRPRPHPRPRRRTGRASRASAARAACARFERCTAPRGRACPAARSDRRLASSSTSTATLPGQPLDRYMSISEYIKTMARSSTTSDVFNADRRGAPSRDPRHADRRREGSRGDRDRPLAVPAAGLEAPAGAQRGRDSSRCRAEGRHRLYRLEPARLQPFQEWLAKYEQALNDRLDRMDDYLKELQEQGGEQ